VRLPVRMSTDLFEKLFLQMVLQMMISIDLMMIDWILLHLFIKNCVLDRLGNSFERYVYWLYDFEGGYVNTKIYKIFKTAAGRPADGRVPGKFDAVAAAHDFFCSLYIL
jgi:hypothetical protein